MGIGLICVPVAILTYDRINKQRAAEMREASERGEKHRYTDQELREMGDRAPDFRYTL